MPRSVISCMIILLPLHTMSAQEAPQRGTIKKVDSERAAITISSTAKDYECTVTNRTRFMDSTGSAIERGLKDERIKEGTSVMFRVVERDGRNMLQGLRLAPSNGDRSDTAQVNTSEFKSLIELGPDEYKSFQGGLYPDGKNERPTAHERMGLELARSVLPRDRAGKPSEQGKIVLMSIGMSNTTQEFSTFKQIADSDRDKNSKLVIVDGAQRGMTAAVIRNPDDNARGSQYWSTVDQRLQAAGVSREQVQVAWVKEADGGPNEGFPKYAQTLQQELADIARLAHNRFPNLKIAYLSCRTYGGYARTRLNPEPYAYESGFAVKWLIEQQIRGEPSLNFDPSKGEIKAPWLIWGPYIWANGTRPNPNGLAYDETDFGEDGTHPSQSGRQKVAQQLLQFLKTDTTARPWFLAD